ncbi:MAG: heat-inducible transcriptional repressor HrcA [Alphaproteobacteria bacterium 16-39-46]|nr:MAG: heat-inducible transcriptional repressor HrcA [Alphaproteobacteria bacterium 16-39-46]OZA41869.1 MAG: heat-inducible transcriptional repressor HrcA [Alphaproteobacteria bacterium 17-39-52]HQS84667.1 heat-inducible transcriptional repressor HrcA [Alphaproteobacteria bacterium]HQS94497.1 heat-inducible transcriptional repressor HrcA [Alphaproteobacteria bacterium]
MDRLVQTLNQRSIEIFRRIVEAYMETGEPVGSRTLSRISGLTLSPATIRNVMADLEEIGFLYAPHISAGRLPTEAGLRFFVNGLLEMGTLTRDEKKNIECLCDGSGKNIQEMLEEATLALSGLSQCAGLVLAPKTEASFKHIEFVNVGTGRVLVILVTDDGSIENRILEVPLGFPSSALTQAGNYLNHRLQGHTLSEAKSIILQELGEDKANLDELTQKIVTLGLGSWAETPSGGTLIVRGQANLLQEAALPEDFSRLRGLFSVLETKETLLNLLEAAIEAEGVQIYIGTENPHYNLTDYSVILSPYTNGRGAVVGAVGVIGPTRLNYGRIIPMVDYTAKVITRLIAPS